MQGLSSATANASGDGSAEDEGTPTWLVEAEGILWDADAPPPGTEPPPLEGPKPGKLGLYHGVAVESSSPTNRPSDRLVTSPTPAAEPDDHLEPVQIDLSESGQYHGVAVESSAPHNRPSERLLTSPTSAAEPDDDLEPVRIDLSTPEQSPRRSEKCTGIFPVHRLQDVLQLVVDFPVLRHGSECCSMRRDGGAICVCQSRAATNRCSMGLLIVGLGLVSGGVFLITSTAMEAHTARVRLASLAGNTLGA